MSIQEQLELTSKYVQNSYYVAEAKGATIPSKKNLERLPSTIASIASSGEAPGSDYQSGIPVGLTEDWATIVFGDNPKTTQFGTYEDTKNFADSCARYSDYIDLAIGTQTRDKVLAYYVGSSCMDVPSNVLNTPIKSEITTQFNNLKLVDLGNAVIVGDNFLAGNPRFTGTLQLSDKLMSIGHDFMANCADFNYDIELPDSLKTVGYNFLYGCNTLPSMYIPEGAKPPSDRNSLSCDNQNALAYLGGLRLRGPGAAKWVTVLPNRDTLPFRNLILEEKGDTYHRVRFQFNNYKYDEVQAVKEGDMAEEPTPTPTYINWYYDHPVVADSADDNCKKPIENHLMGYIEKDNSAQHSVILEFENGMPPQALYVEHEEKVRERFDLNNSPRVIFSDGHKFLGWFQGEPGEIQRHRVEIDPENGEEPRVTQVVSGFCAWTPKEEPVKIKRKFLGWTDEDIETHTVTLETIDDIITKKVPDGFSVHPVPVLTEETEEGVFIGWEIAE